MPLTPTTPTDPAQRIDSVYINGQLVEELVWTYPFDGTAVRRRDGQPDQPVTGLPIPTPPEPTAEERLATLLAALADAQTLGDVREAAQIAGGA